MRNGLWRSGHLVVGTVFIFGVMVSGCGARPASLEAILGEKSGMLSDNYPDWKIDTVVAKGRPLAVVRGDQQPVRRIYIEGDGRAFFSRGQPSGDPTPLNPVALDVMLKQGDGAALYVARPCQWVRGPECSDTTLWTDKRFTLRVIEQYEELIQREANGSPVELVGYSGGAWVALQVAARLPNVTRVTTIAGNLMPDWVNREHRVTDIPVMPYPRFTRDVPVTAYIGVEDKIVGSGVIPAFQAATGLQVEVIEILATHGEGWDILQLP